MSSYVDGSSNTEQLSPELVLYEGTLRILVAPSDYGINF